MVEHEMTDRERIISVFQRRSVDRIVWQPRIEHWYHVNKVTGSLPKPYRDMSLLEVYRDLPASVRYYYDEGTDISTPRTYIRTEYTGGVAIRETRKRDTVRVDFITPVGELTGLKGLAEHGLSWHYLEHPVKTPGDLTVIEYIYRHTHYRFDFAFYNQAREAMGGSGEIQFYWERSPFQRLYLEYLGIAGTSLALYDYPDRIREYLRITEEAEDELFEVLALCPVNILNFGENLDGRFNSPRIFSKYLVPYYRKRVDQLHRAGKFCHVHLDGILKPLLPLLKDPGFDGIEAATPLPQGDVTLEELKEAMGEMVLLDGIPMLYFLPEYSQEELESTTRQVIDLFSPHLILGISDEISPLGDIERVKLVARIVAEYGNA
ncbi:MAG TPA: uroporphyrinogen decarboxylase family protein [Atribacteraceae bacterium]|nr:uroporphyrinogen decarboxylase family protein [Atribacteraceae bacterium]